MPDTTVTLDPATLDRNLDALARTDRAVAGQLAAAREHMPEATPAPTRDGQINLRIRTLDGREVWFGRTSIPLARAQSMLEQFDPGHGNVLFPGVAQGTEVGLMLHRLAAHRVVFVWEEDPIQLLLALRLHDWSAAIESQRLVLVMSDSDHLTDALVRCLEARNGHLCPERIMMWPWHTLSSIAGCRTSVEAAYRQIERDRAAKLAQVRALLDGLPSRSDDQERTAVVLSIHPLQETLALADSLVSASAPATLQVVSSVVRSPADVHPLARAERLMEGLQHRPDVALLLETGRTDVADVLPPGVPAISWLSHATPLDASVTKRIGPDDKIMAVDSLAAERLTGAGIDRERISVHPWPCLLSAQESPPGWDARPIDVAVLANLTSVEPTAYGHDLPTHCKVWQVAVELLRERIDDFMDGQIGGILDRAESRLRVKIEEPGARRAIAELLSGPVATSLLWGHISQVIIKQKLKSGFWGAGWSGEQHQGPLPAWGERQAVYRRCKCVVFVSPVGVVSPDLLLAASCGAVVLWRAHPRDRQPGGLETLLRPDSEVLTFANSGALFRTLTNLLSTPDRWREMATAAWQRSQADHLPARRLADVSAVAASFPPGKST